MDFFLQGNPLYFFLTFLKRKMRELLLNLIRVHFTSNSNGKFFYKEIPWKNLVTHTSLILPHSTCKTSAGLEQNLHFWWKIFRFGRIFFLHLDLQACPNSSRIRTVEIFFIPKSNELEHSAGVENFPQHLDLFVCQISAEMKKLEDFPLPKICNFFFFFFFRIAWFGTFCRGNFFPKFQNSDNLFFWP